MMFYRQPDTRSDEERYLQDQLDQEREWREQLEREREKAREARMAEMRQRHEEYYRTAETWPEALDKQAHLMGRETDLDGEEGIGASTTTWYFTDGVNACNRALELWREREKEIVPQVEELERQIAELKAGIALQVAEQLLDEMPTEPGHGPGWRGIAQQLQDDPAGEELDNWLYW